MAIKEEAVEAAEEVTKENTEVAEVKEAGEDLKAPGAEAVEEEKNDDQADKAEEEDGEDADPDKASTDIVFPEDTTLTEEQQSEVKEIFGTQDVYDKAIDFLQNISSEQIAKNEVAAEKSVADNEESLKKDPDFGKDFPANMKSVDDLAAEIGEDFAKKVNTKDPVVAKGLLKLVRERSDADIHVNKNVKTKVEPLVDASGNKQVDFGKTMKDLKERT